MTRLLRPLGLLIAIPVLSILASYYMADLGAYRERLDFWASNCGWGTMFTGLEAALASLCSGDGFAGIMLRASLIVLGFAIAPLLIFLGAALICGANRHRVAVVFPKLIPLAMFFVMMNVLLQGLLLIYLLEVLFILIFGKKVATLVFIGPLGVALAAVWVVRGMVRGLYGTAMEVHGEVIGEERAPELWRAVREIAGRLNAPAPNHIIVGLEPTFWVINGEVEASGSDRLLLGRTLFLSAPLMRLLDRDEFASIVAHELGHFRGEDTEYSARFVPVYGALMGAHEGLDESADSVLNHLWFILIILVVLDWPMRMLLNLLSDCFSLNVQRISRIREYAADQAALEVAPPAAFATALIRTSTYSGLWGALHGQHLKRALRGYATVSNPSEAFAKTGPLYVDAETEGKIRAEALDDATEHPFDSHPSNLNRIRAVGIDPATLKDFGFRSESLAEPAFRLVGGLDYIEEDLVQDLVGEWRKEVVLIDELGGPEADRSFQNREFDAIYGVLAPYIAEAPSPAAAFRAALEAAAEVDAYIDGLALAMLVSMPGKAMPFDDAIAFLDATPDQRTRPQMAAMVGAIWDAVRETHTAADVDELARLKAYFDAPSPAAERTGPWG